MTQSATEAPKGLVLNLYRSEEFGTNPNRNLLHGVHQVTLVGVRHDSGAVQPLPKSIRVLTPTQSRPAAVLHWRDIMGQRIPSIVPLAAVEEDKWVAHGGSYAATSDSRFSALTKQYGAISVHDWYEGD